MQKRRLNQCQLFQRQFPKSLILVKQFQCLNPTIFVAKTKLMFILYQEGKKNTVNKYKINK